MILPSEVPPLPRLGVPGDLLAQRPDLQKLFFQLIAADFLVAEALANRLPALRIGGQSQWSGTDFTPEGLASSLFGEMVAPLLNWGRLKAEEERKRAMVKEKLAQYSQAYLQAIEEVENALVREKYQRRLLTATKKELALAEANLQATKERYLQGLTDYLPVLIALQSVQTLEQKIIERTRELISHRILLYRALGGSRLFGG